MLLCSITLALSFHEREREEKEDREERKRRERKKREKREKRKRKRKRKIKRRAERDERGRMFCSECFVFVCSAKELSVINRHKRDEWNNSASVVYADKSKLRIVVNTVEYSGNRSFYNIIQLLRLLRLNRPLINIGFKGNHDC